MQSNFIARVKGHFFNRQMQQKVLINKIKLDITYNKSLEELPQCQRINIQSYIKNNKPQLSSTNLLNQYEIYYQYAKLELEILSSIQFQKDQEIKKTSKKKISKQNKQSRIQWKYQNQQNHNSFEQIRQENSKNRKYNKKKQMFVEDQAIPTQNSEYQKRTKYFRNIKASLSVLKKIKSTKFGKIYQLKKNNSIKTDKKQLKMHIKTTVKKMEQPSHLKELSKQQGKTKGQEKCKKEKINDLIIVISYFKVQYFHMDNNIIQIIKMSIYSGFATRNQQNYYDKIIYNVISTLIVRLAKFYNNQNVDEDKFQRIISKQQKIMKKMEKRKYLQPKYSHLLQQLLIIIPSYASEKGLSRQKLSKRGEMNRTLSLIDKEMHTLKQQAQKYMSKVQTQQQPSRNLDRIQQVSKPSKKRKSKSKKTSVKSYLDLWDVRHQKLPQIPSLHPIEHTMLTKNHFFSNKNDSVGQVQYPISQKDDWNGQGMSNIGKRTYFNKPLNFRTNVLIRK